MAWRQEIKKGIIVANEFEACIFPKPKTISLRYYRLMANRLVEIDKR
jgi:hypothetical protein